MRKAFTYLMAVILLTASITTPITYPSYAVENLKESPDEWFIIENGVLYGFNESYLEENGILTPIDISIPDGITAIAQEAFAYSSIRSVSFPSTLKTIGTQAFFKCIDLEKVYFNEGLNTIGQQAFAITGLKSIKLPSSTKVIQNYAFTLCESLTDVQLNKGLTTLSDGAFSYSQIELIIIPASVSKIGNYAFESCRNLTNAIINEGVEVIGINAFHGTSVRSIDFPSTMVDIQTGAFLQANQLSEISLNEGLQSIGEDSFKDCNLFSVYMPSTVNTIGTGSFSGNINLNQVINKAATQTFRLGALPIHEALKYAYGYSTNTSYYLDLVNANYLFKNLESTNQPIITNVNGIKQDNENVLITVETDNPSMVSDYSFDNGSTWIKSNFEILPINVPASIQIKSIFNETSDTYSFEFKDDTKTPASKNYDIEYNVQVVETGSKPIGQIILAYKKILEASPKTVDSNSAKRANDFLDAYGKSYYASFK